MCSTKKHYQVQSGSPGSGPGSAPTSLVTLDEAILISPIHKIRGLKKGFSSISSLSILTTDAERKDIFRSTSLGTEAS